MPNFWAVKIYLYVGTITNLQIVLNTRKKSLLKSSNPKRYLPKFSTPKNPELENVEPPKNPSITPVTWNPSKIDLSRISGAWKTTKGNSVLRVFIILDTQGKLAICFSFVQIKICWRWIRQWRPTIKAVYVFQQPSDTNQRTLHQISVAKNGNHNIERFMRISLTTNVNQNS